MENNSAMSTTANIRSKHGEYLVRVESFFKGMRTLVRGQESALSRLILASLSARPQTVRRRDGKETVGEPSRVSSCAHVRMLGSPGIGKTHLASCLSLFLNCDFVRIECTSDKQPTDIIGTFLPTEKNESVFSRGPLLTANVVLADEITNATPRTQRALLAGLSEDFISVEDVLGDMGKDEGRAKNRIPLREPFFFMATQNPVTEEGTYIMPRAILDRFSETLRFRHLSVQEIVSLQKMNEQLTEAVISSRIERELFMRIREFIFTEMVVPPETAYFIAVMVRLLDPSAHEDKDPLFRRLYDEVWEQCFERQERKLIAVAMGDVRGARAYRFSDLIMDALVERPALFLRYLGKALAFTKTEENGGMREYVVPSDILKIYSDVMFHRIGLTNLGENLAGGNNWLVDGMIDFLINKVRRAHWFFSALPDAARRFGESR